MKLEPAVGELLELSGKKYKCVKNGHCSNCDLDWHKDDCVNVYCGSLSREDSTNVIFKLVINEPNKSNSNQ